LQQLEYPISGIGSHPDDTFLAKPQAKSSTPTTRAFPEPPYRPLIIPVKGVQVEIFFLWLMVCIASVIGDLPSFHQQ
jgi:hypothetical protein